MSIPKEAMSRLCRYGKKQRCPLVVPGPMLLSRHVLDPSVQSMHGPSMLNYVTSLLMFHVMTQGTRETAGPDDVEDHPCQSVAARPASPLRRLYSLSSSLLALDAAEKN